MMLGRFSRVVRRVLGMAVRYVSVMASLFMIPSFVMLGSLTMVFRRVLVMFGRLVVVVRTFVCRHLCFSPFKSSVSSSRLARLVDPTPAFSFQ
jgi:uncharacterized membrane protein